MPRLGPPVLQSELVQMQELDDLRQQISHHQSRGYEVLLADESTFSANSYQRRNWSLPHQPHKVTRRYIQQPCIAVLGFISASYGKIHFAFNERSMKSEQVIAALKAVREAYGEGPKLSVLWDNASIHRAKVVRAAAASDEINIKLIPSAKYRPDI